MEPYMWGIILFIAAIAAAFMLNYLNGTGSMRETLGFKPNDWMLVWTESEIWRFTHIETGQERLERCFYHIYFSKSRNKYKLKTSGQAPEDHSYYAVACQKLAELNKELLKL